MPNYPSNRRYSARNRGLSLIEVLMSLAITSMLMTGAAVAIDASFKAYAYAAETAGAQSATRMITHRILTLMRTSTAHGPLITAGAVLVPNSSNPPLVLNGNTLTSHYTELVDPQNNIIRIEYRDQINELWAVINPGLGQVAQPLLAGVTACQFTSLRRQNSAGLWVLERGTMALSVQPGADSTLAIESGYTTPIQVVASTMPRKLD